MPHHILWGSRSLMASTRRMWNWLKRNSTLILLLLLSPQMTCTHKYMHAHMHICTDVEPPSAPAAPCLAPLCLLPRLWPLTYYSVYAVTLTPNHNLNLPLYSLGLLFLASPWVFRWFPCAVSLASMPLSVELSVWRQSFTGRVWRGIWALDRLILHPTVPSAQGGVFYQVATPLPLSSRAFPVGRTRSRTGSVLNGQPYFFSFCFWFVYLFFVVLCAHTVNLPKTELSNN